MPSFRQQVKAFKLTLVQTALARHRGNARLAAKDLQMPRSTLLDVLRRDGVELIEDDVADDPPLAFAIASVEERLGLDRRLTFTFYACWTVAAITEAAIDGATVAFALESDTARRLVDRANEELKARVIYG